MRISIISVLAILLAIIAICSFLTMYSLKDLLYTLDKPYSKERLDRIFRDSIILILASTVLMLAFAAIVFIFTHK
ncbi:MAG: hypothetical protein DSO07_05215 [Thermoproteota archaeon]|nr:MAG: hypothetical protein DSO07_05215 [Candidatus Korarchaeota archaeon]